MEAVHSEVRMFVAVVLFYFFKSLALNIWYLIYQESILFNLQGRVLFPPPATISEYLLTTINSLLPAAFLMKL